MLHRIVSVVVFYKTDGTILIQDRTNMNKNADWWLFGWGREWDEDEYETAIREIHEELHISLTKADLTKIGYTVVDKIWTSRYDVTVFISPWKDEYNSTIVLGEGAWILWITPEDMKKLANIYSVDHSHMDIIQNYFNCNNIGIKNA